MINNVSTRTAPSWNAEGVTFVRLALDTGIILRG